MPKLRGYVDKSSVDPGVLFTVVHSASHVHAVRHHTERFIEIELPSVVMTKAFPNDTGLPVVMCSYSPSMSFYCSF